MGKGNPHELYIPRKVWATMTDEEKLAHIDTLIDRDAEMWKKYIRESAFGFADFCSRRHRKCILFPTQM